MACRLFVMIALLVSCGDAPPDARPCSVTKCGLIGYACADCIDNDGDGLLDDEDPECLAACDDTEDSLYSGLPSAIPDDCLVRCYFDDGVGESGSACHWSHRCDSHEVAPAYYPEHERGAACAYDPVGTVSRFGTCADHPDLSYEWEVSICFEECANQVPNGCDCFGCCDVPGVGGVYLGSVDAEGRGTCTLADLADPTRCQRCDLVEECFNDCAPCEVCFGREPELEGCSAAERCGDTQPCGQPGDEDCGFARFCVTGCCRHGPYELEE